MPNNALNKIEHIVVLMMENRSFDNVLGWLYDPGNQPPFNEVPRGQSFEGLSGKDLSNPRPDGSLVPVGKGTDMTDPFPDPNEPYDQVFAQMYNQNPPPTPIPNMTTSPDMQGFVINYAEAMSPLGNASAEDCANFCVMMFSDYTRMVTMQNLFHDGGFSFTGVTKDIIEQMEK